MMGAQKKRLSESQGAPGRKNRQRETPARHRAKKTVLAKEAHQSLTLANRPA